MVSIFFISISDLSKRQYTILANNKKFKQYKKQSQQMHNHSTSLSILSPYSSKHQPHFSSSISSASPTFPSASQSILPQPSQQCSPIPCPKIDSLNRALSRYGPWQIPECISTMDNQQGQHLLEMIGWLIGQIKTRDQQYSKLTKQHRITTKHLLHTEQMLQQQQNSQKSQEQEHQNLQHQHTRLQQTHRQELQKQQALTNQLQKQIKKIQARERAIEAEFRKKDGAIRDLQDCLRKMHDRDTHRTQRSASKLRDAKDPRESKAVTRFQVFVGFTQGKYDEVKDGKKEYDLLALAKFQEALKNVTRENGRIKEFLFRLLSSLYDIIQLINQEEEHSFYSGKSQPLKMPILSFIHQPYQIAQPKLSQILKNIQRIASYIKKLQQKSSQLLPTSTQPSPTRSPKFQNLLSNFMQVTKCQDQLLTRILDRQQLIGCSSSPSSGKYNYVCQPDISLQHEEMYNQAVDVCEFGMMSDLIQQHLTHIQNKNKHLLESKQKLVEGMDRTARILGHIAKEREIVYGGLI